MPSITPHVSQATPLNTITEMSTESSDSSSCYSSMVSVRLANGTCNVEVETEEPAANTGWCQRARDLFSEAGNRLYCFGNSFTTRQALTTATIIGTGGIVLTAGGFVSAFALGGAAAAAASGMTTPTPTPAPTAPLPDCPTTANNISFNLITGVNGNATHRVRYGNHQSGEAKTASDEVQERKGGRVILVPAGQQYIQAEIIGGSENKTFSLDIQELNDLNNPQVCFTYNYGSGEIINRSNKTTDCDWGDGEETKTFVVPQNDTAGLIETGLENCIKVNATEIPLTTTNK